MHQQRIKPCPAFFLSVVRHMSLRVPYAWVIEFLVSTCYDRLPCFIIIIHMFKLFWPDWLSLGRQRYARERRLRGEFGRANIPCDFPGLFRTRACQADRSDFGPKSSYAKNLKEPSEIFLENTEKKTKQNKTKLLIHWNFSMVTPSFAEWNFIDLHSQTKTNHIV